MAASFSIGRLALLSVVLWLALLIYMSTMLDFHKRSKTSSGSGEIDGNSEKVHASFGDRRSNDDSESIKVQQRLAKAVNDIELLRKQNLELKSLLRSKNDSRVLNRKSGITSNREINQFAQMDSIDLSPYVQGLVLSRQHQTLRRSVENGLVELWYAAMSKLKKLKEQLKPSTPEADALKQLTKELTEQHRTVLVDALRLFSVDGQDSQRQIILWNLTQIVQNRISYLQNPIDCRSARKLVCQLNKGCGFGCQLHHVSYCLIVAYATQRTMILDSRGWRYSQKGWDSIFLPVSSNCRNFTDDMNAETWKGEESQANVQVVSLPIIDGVRPRPPQLPLSFPEEFSEKLLALHGNPPVWWVGQFIWYLMRYQTDFQNDLTVTARRLNFTSPCVGIHVRRTDKVGSEAAFHALDEYMQFVEAWFKLEALRNGSTSTAEFESMTKRVYLATDEPALYAEARRNYPSYTFVGDIQVANTAQLSSRYTDSSLRGVVADIHFLSRCDYLVCTFSSQVCRVAYELMQVLRGDAAPRFHSLDDVYYFGGQEAHEQIAILPHKAASPSEIDLEVDDVIGIAGNHWDGYSKGKNERTGQIGLYPSYKVREKWRIVRFPTYPEADSKLRQRR